MEISYIEQIKSRKSVRSFDGSPLRTEDRQMLEAFIGSLENPFHVPVCFRILNAREYGLSSPVIVGTDCYLAAKVSRTEHFEIGFGYSFEKVCLFAQSLGIGTVILAASLSRAAFEKAMEVGNGEVLPVASPLGYPAEKRSIRESLMRKALKADERLPFDVLFFDGSFEKGLSQHSAGVFGEALEMVRWAPSAGNQQPVRAVVGENTVHFFERQTMKESALGDIQKVDVGIALCHFDLVMAELGKSGTFLFHDPELVLPDRMKYIVSYRLN